MKPLSAMQVLYKQFKWEVKLTSALVAAQLTLKAMGYEPHDFEAPAAPRILMPINCDYLNGKSDRLIDSTAIYRTQIWGAG